MRPALDAVISLIRLTYADDSLNSRVHQRSSSRPVPLSCKLLPADSGLTEQISGCIERDAKYSG